MSTRETYDEIFNNFINGNLKDMTKQLDSLGSDIPEFINYFAYDLNRLDELPALLRSYFKIKYS